MPEIEYDNRDNGVQETRLSSTRSAEDLLEQCQVLLRELEVFREYLVTRRKEKGVDLGPFRNSVQSELKSLERLSKADPTTERTRHTLRSSNLPFYTSVWTTAKRCTGLLAFNKRFYWDIPPPRTSDADHRYRRHRKNSVLVDIVAQDGAEWVKVSTITETRLMFEMAKAGWEGYVSDSEGESSAGDDGVEDDVSLVKLAEDLARAAKMERVRYRHPSVRFVLPKTRFGQVPEVDRVISDIRATGAIVQCSDEVAKSVSLLEDVKESMTIDDFASFTSTLNIDCTILLALVSDLSHGRVTPEPWFHRAIRRQIELEEREQLLPTSLFPAMGDRALLCTIEAANRMKEIVELIGTPAEKARTALLIGDHEVKGREQLVAEFQALSEYEIPKQWNLPIKVVDRKLDQSSLPHTAAIVSKDLTAINCSVFLYGWATRLTTISSNRTVAKLIETVVEANRKDDEEEGPSIWLCPTARSLVGKEKNRRT
ncbi:MAG: hypothetical protein M1827_001416 [Pycnora praestabilis]|nr:MAG: hypothetical protein M1827_001416 [Pycnora praestabilis]